MRLHYEAGSSIRHGPHLWVFITGGCSGRGVQQIGVVLYSKLVYNSIQITTPCFHSTSPLMNLELGASAPDEKKSWQR